jgi:hypothetical protein
MPDLERVKCGVVPTRVGVNRFRNAKDRRKNKKAGKRAVPGLWRVLGKLSKKSSRPQAENVQSVRRSWVPIVGRPGQKNDPSDWRPKGRLLVWSPGYGETE